MHAAHTVGRSTHPHTHLVLPEELHAFSELDLQPGSLLHDLLVLRAETLEAALLSVLFRPQLDKILEGMDATATPTAQA